MEVIFKNLSDQHLAKTHINKITKDALKRVEKQSSAMAVELSLNQKQTAVYDMLVSGGTSIDIKVTSVNQA